MQTELQRKPFHIDKMRGKGKEPWSIATVHSPFIPPLFSPLCPLSSFTFTLHPAGLDLVASYRCRDSDVVYRNGLWGLAVSAVCKVVSAVSLLVTN